MEMIAGDQKREHLEQGKFRFDVFRSKKLVILFPTFP